jgi:hypothetical protein
MRRSSCLNSARNIATSRIGVVETTDAVRVPVASRPISPITSPGPSVLISSPSLSTSALPSSITNSQ